MRSTSVVHATVDPHTVKVPLSDGDDIRFERLSTASGLSQTRVLQIVQDDKGFMWFGTQYGLDRYDGHTYKVYTPDPARVNSICGAYIYALFKDDSGKLWIGCDQFLDRFDPTTETFTHYRLQSEDSSHVPITVVHISQDRTGELWLASGSGLYGFDPSSGRIIHHYANDPLNSSSLSSNDLRSTGEDREGRFWVAEDSNLEQFDRKTGQVTLRISLEESMRDTVSFHEDRFGKFWIANGASRGGIGLAALDRTTNKLTRYSFYDLKSGKTVDAGVVAILEDKDGILWLATTSEGLLRFDPQHGRIVRYRNRTRNPRSIAENRVIALAQDDEGNIWAGLHAREPNFFSTRSLPFKPLLRESLSPDSMGEYLVNAIYEDHEGVLWVGVSGSLIRIDRGTGKYTFYRPSGYGLNYAPIAITEDHSGVIWVGTLGQGLDSFDRRTGKFKTYLHDPSNPQSLSNNVVGQLTVDHAGIIWLATWNGLTRLDPATDRFTVYRSDVDKGTEYFYDVSEDHEGGLWLGSPAGLQHFDPLTGKFRRYVHNLNDPKSLSDNRVTSVNVDHLDTVWATTENGLDKLDRVTGTFTNYYVKDGLPSNRVHCIVEDPRGGMWMSTNRGLSRFSLAGKTFTNYTVADGLPGLDLTGWHACFASPTGTVFFGGFAGATAFYPDGVNDNPYSPPVVFTDFRLSGHSVEVGLDSPLKKSISYVDKIVLSHQQSTFSVEFAALSYNNSSANRYRYMLEGLDRRWNEAASDQRVLNYQALPTGEYTLRVQVETGQGGWSAPGAALRIEVLPAWWNSWWFRTIYILLFLLLLLTLYLHRLRQIAGQFNLRLEERLGERTRIARELHDTLLQSFQGLMIHIQSVEELLPDRPVDAKEALEGALGRADRALIEGRDAIKDMRVSARNNHDLGQSLTTLMNDVRQELASGNQDLVTFRVKTVGTPQTVRAILYEEVYCVARELMRNAFRHAQAHRIELEIIYGDRLLRLHIRDDGRGIDPKILEEGGGSGHWGILGMNERAKRIGATLDIRSKVGEGTEIELSIPGHIAYDDSSAGSGLRPFRAKSRTRR